jgi:hypothetical protein
LARASSFTTPKTISTSAPEARPCAAKARLQREIYQVRCQALCLQRVPAQDPMHEEQEEGTLAQAQLR